MWESSQFAWDGREPERTLWLFHLSPHGGCVRGSSSPPTQLSASLAGLQLSRFILWWVSGIISSPRLYYISNGGNSSSSTSCLCPWPALLLSLCISSLPRSCQRSVFSPDTFSSCPLRTASGSKTDAASVLKPNPLCCCGPDNDIHVTMHGETEGRWRRTMRAPVGEARTVAVKERIAERWQLSEQLVLSFSLLNQLSHFLKAEQCGSHVVCLSPVRGAQLVSHTNVSSWDFFDHLWSWTISR